MTVYQSSVYFVMRTEGDTDDGVIVFVSFCVTLRRL